MKKFFISVLTALMFIYSGLAQDVPLRGTLTLEETSINDAISAGKHKWVDDDINQKNFPLDPSLDGEWEWEIYDPKDNFSQGILNEMSIDGWMPARAQHLFAFGAKYPGAQRTNTIAGLGSSFIDDFGLLRFPILDSGDDERGLLLDNWHREFDPYYRFLRVRRLST